MDDGTLDSVVDLHEAPAAVVAGPCATLGRFANPDVVLEGWYPVMRASRLRSGEVRSLSIGGRDLVLWRGLGGELHAVERACAHLGADLANGKVIAKGLQCAFHSWCWSGEGACVAGGGAREGRRIRAYAAREKWGLAWIWAGREPAYELPDPKPDNLAHVLVLPAQTLPCHPHVMLGNGLDVTHVVPVHRFRFEGEPALDLEPPHRISVNVHARFEATTMRRLLGLAGKDARWCFTNIGPSLAWVGVTHPTPFELLWAGTPLPGGRTRSQTIFFLPRMWSLVRAFPMIMATTWADRKVLSGLEFRGNFVRSDHVFEAYARLVEEMPIWS